MSKLFSLTILLTSMIIFALTMLSSKNLPYLKSIKEDIGQAQNKNSERESLISNLKSDVRKIKNSELILERRAREEFKMSKPDEVIYVFDK